MTNEDSKSGESFFSSMTFFENPDRVIVGKLPVKEGTTPETGRDRLRKMFSLDEYGYYSKELVFLSQIFYGSTLGGALVGSVIQSRNAFLNFIENNQATKFGNQMDAKRELQRVMYLAFGKGAWQFGWRVSLFSMSFTTLTTVVSVYRGKESMIEYLVAGGVTGGLWKMNMGLKGAFAGCLAGSVLGGIMGASSLLLLKIGGTSMDEMRSFSKHLKDIRAEALRNKATEAVMRDDEDLAIKKGMDDSLLTTLDVDEGSKPSQ